MRVDIAAATRPGRQVRRLCAAALCAVLALTSWRPLAGAPVQAPSPTVRLYGYVTEIDGGAVESVVVDIWDDFGNDLAHVPTQSTGLYEVFLPPRDVYHLRFTQWIESGPYAYHKYLPGSGEARPGSANEVRCDAALRPAANLILELYNPNGEQVRYADFAPVYQGYFFVTDAEDLPVAWEVNAVQDPVFQQHGGDWDWALPTLLLAPEAVVRLHLNWSVPDVGQVIIDLDGGADGYATPARFGYRALNVNRELALSAVNRLALELSTFSSQGYAFSLAVTAALSESLASLMAGDIHWGAEPRESVPALTDWEDALSVALLAQEKLYLEKASVDIPRNRQGGLTLSVRAANGLPIAGAVVTYEQRTRDFLFSGGSLTDGWGFVPETADRMQEMGVNAGAVGVSFGAIEPAPGVFDWSLPDTYSGLAPMLARGFSVNAAVAYWAFPLYEWECPAYWRDLSFEQYKALLFNHYRALAERYGTRMNPWMINEPTTANCLNLTWEQRLEVVQVVMDGLHAGYPGAENLVTALAMPYGWSQEPLPEEGAELPFGLPFPAYLDLLRARGLPLDNIGLEMHFFGVSVPEGGNYVLPGMTLASLARLLDHYDSYGVPVWIEPFQVPSQQVTGSAWWHRPWDEVTQAEFAVAFYSLAFSRKNLHDICWSDATDRAPFIVSAGLLDRERQPKPAYYALQDLLASWSTRGVGVTDDRGEVKIQGYGGEYAMRLSIPRGGQLQVTPHITEQKQTRETIVLHSLCLPLVARSAGREAD